MLNILHDDMRVCILIYPAQVQGESAAAEVAAGVKYFNRAKNVDVIIVARGGGSVEDLAPSTMKSWRGPSLPRDPGDLAVGHETDFTIADFVADLRAPTPSAAAELVIESKHRLAEHLAHLHQRLARATRYRLLMARASSTTWPSTVRLPAYRTCWSAARNAWTTGLSAGGKLSRTAARVPSPLGCCRCACPPFRFQALAGHHSRPA